jgi:peptide deformylase
MKKLVLSVVFSTLLLACGSRSAFTVAEREIILAAPDSVPFRVLQITGYNDSITLRAICTDLQNYEKDTVFQHFIKRLECTLHAAGGVGIAASQVGICRNVFLFMHLDLPNEPITLAVNPKITATPDTMVCFERDGCLSIPNFSGNSVRYAWVDVEYFSAEGKKISEQLKGYSRTDDFTGIIFQHEYDHTKGVLFIDKLCK